MARTGSKLKLTKQKLKQVFDIAINTAPTPKYIAYGLGVKHVDTIKSWVMAGISLQDTFEDKLEELDEISPWKYREIWEQSKKLEADAEFRQIHQIDPDTPIPDRQKLDYNMFLSKHRELYVERSIEREEWDILDELELAPDEQQDNEFKLFIEFSRIFNRAKTVVEMGLLSSVNKHAHTSKNIALGYKLLQTYNKEDFADTQVVKHEGTIDVNTRSILALAIDYERQQKQALEQKNTPVIDVTPVQMLEQRDE